MTEPLWINTPADLDARLQSPPERIGLDTEFIRERTYWPRLALVQMAVREEILLIDPLLPGMPEALARWLAHPGIVKVMHGASEDLVAFKHACATLPRPLYDTQIAAALAGIGSGMGYQKLVEQVTGVTVDKGETRSDWMRRPLSDAQLRYAADDVAYLFAVHDATAAKLATLGRSHWQQQDAERLLCTVEQDVEPWPHLAMRAAQFLDAPAQRRLLRLLRWRDAQARHGDKPRSWILDNELAVTLARSAAATPSAVNRLLDASPRAPRKLADALWQALSMPLPDEDGMPLALAADESHKRQLKRLQQAVADCSAALGLPDGVLASRRHLESLLESRHWPAALGGWRREQLHNRLMPLLD